MCSPYPTSLSRDSMEPVPPSPPLLSPLIIDSPTHQYVITGSSSNQINGDRIRLPKFHFPSANPSSPTDMGNHDNNMFNGDICDHGDGGRGEREVTPNTKRRRRLNEMMHSSIEGGLGQIMTLVVGESGEDHLLPARLEEGDRGGRDEGRGGEGEGEEREGEGTEEDEREGEEEEDGEGEKQEEEEVEEEEVVENEGEGEVFKEQEGGREDMITSGSEVTDDCGVTDTLTETMASGVTPPEVESHSHVLEPQSSEPSPNVTIEMTLDPPSKPITQSLTQETSLTVHPTVHSKSSLCLYSSKLSQFHSEMSMLDALAAILDENIKAAAPRERLAGGHSRRSQSVHIRPTFTKPDKPDSLVSPQRRNKLIDEAAKRISLKRAHTVDLDHTHSHPSKKGDGGTDLLSGARKAKLLNQALATVRERRQVGQPEATLTEESTREPMS